MIEHIVALRSVFVEAYMQSYFVEFFRKTCEGIRQTSLLEIILESLLFLAVYRNSWESTLLPRLREGRVGSTQRNQARIMVYGFSFWCNLLVQFVRLPGFVSVCIFVQFAGLAFWFTCFVGFFDVPL